MKGEPRPFAATQENTLKVKLPDRTHIWCNEINGCNELSVLPDDGAAPVQQ